MAAVPVAALSKTYRFHHKEAGLRGSIQSLFKLRVRETVAVQDVSFTVQPGEIVGFLSFLVPIAFATTFPAEALLGNVDLRLIPVGLLLAAASLYASHRFWLLAVRRYASADG